MKPFTDILREFRRGAIANKLTEEMAELVRSVDETGKPGSLTLTLTVKPEKGGGSQKTLGAKIKSSRPDEDLPEAIFFSDREGDLHRNDPDQRALFADADDTSERAEAQR